MIKPGVCDLKSTVKSSYRFKRSVYVSNAKKVLRNSTSPATILRFVDSVNLRLNEKQYAEVSFIFSPGKVQHSLDEKIVSRFADLLAAPGTIYIRPKF